MLLSATGCILEHIHDYACKVDLISQLSVNNLRKYREIQHPESVQTRASHTSILVLFCCLLFKKLRRCVFETLLKGTSFVDGCNGYISLRASCLWEKGQ